MTAMATLAAGIALNHQSKTPQLQMRYGVKITIGGAESRLIKRMAAGGGSMNIRGGSTIVFVLNLDLHTGLCDIFVPPKI
ncbi:MAG: hypothetical protein ACYT04_37015 [Nostoc sp.]